MFSRKGAWVDRPVTVSCGQCVSCRLERSRQWAIRCIHEAQLHEKNSFITLTYDQDHIPADGSLDVSHWQKFAKRLRKNIGPFRFLHCGEYGESNFRPHYHACIFGLDFRDDSQIYQHKTGYDVRTSPALTETWGKGFCTVGDLTFESAAYVARYVMKKIGGPMADEHYRRIDVDTGEETHVKREYVTMSRRPGLGSDWIDRYESDVYPDDFVVHENHKLRPPKFYDRRLEEKNPKSYEELKTQRVQRALKHAENNTPERLDVRRKITDARLGQLPRSL